MHLSTDRAITAGAAGGIALIAIGVVAYVLTDFASLTALIPAIFGLMMGVVAGLGRVPRRRRRSIIAIGLLGLLVALGSLRGVPAVVELLSGGDVETPVAVVAQGLSVLVGAVVAAVSAVALRQVE